MKDLFQHIFLSSDPENEANKELVYDCLYLPWLKGEFVPEFAPEWAGSYLIVLQKAGGGIRGITPVDISTGRGNAIVQATQQTAAKTYIDTYTNFKQLTLSKDGVSHRPLFPERGIFRSGLYVGRGRGGSHGDS